MTTDRNTIINENELTIERIFDAPLEAVWNAWTDPQQFKQWYGPHGWKTPVCEIDLRVGGRFLFGMEGKMPNGNRTEVFSAGVYQEIVLHKKIVASEYPSDNEGNRAPMPHHGGSGEDPGEDMLMTITFEEVEGKTRLTFHHRGMTAEMYQGASYGWNSAFDKLDNLLKEI